MLRNDAVSRQKNKEFHVIIIAGKYRHECSKNAVKCLSEGGFIILDNSYWYPKTVGILREHGLIQTDFSGFSPVNDYTWTTSLFFEQKFFRQFSF